MLPMRSAHLTGAAGGRAGDLRVLLGVAGRAVLLDAVDVHLAGAGPNQRLDRLAEAVGDDLAALGHRQVDEAVLFQVVAVARDEVLPPGAEVAQDLHHLLQVVGMQQVLALAIGLIGVVQDGEAAGVVDRVLSRPNSRRSAHRYRGRSASMSGVPERKIG
jgi:hypothetical protein